VRSLIAPQIYGSSRPFCTSPLEGSTSASGLDPSESILRILITPQIYGAIRGFSIFTKGSNSPADVDPIKKVLRSFFAPQIYGAIRRIHNTFGGI